MSIRETGTPAGQDVAQTDFARDSGASTLTGFVRDYVSRVRGGEVGALPAMFGLIVLAIIFSQASDQFLTVPNLANLVGQAGITVFIAMGLVFVLLLGEIDLAAGTASGVCAGLMGLSLTKQGDVHAALGTTVWVIVLVFMLAAVVIAAVSRLWYAAAIVLVGGVMMLFSLWTSSELGAIALAVSAGVAIGLVTGFLVSRIGIPSFVVTLALFLGWQGVLLQFIGNGQSISTGDFDLINKISNGNLSQVLGWVLYAVLIAGYAGITLMRSLRRRRAGLSADPIAVVVSRVAALAVVGAVAVLLLNRERAPHPEIKSIKGVPYVLPLILIFMIFWSFILIKTRFGRYLYAVGGNAEAARRAGVDLRRIRIAAFAITSGMAAVGGIVQASRQGGINADAGGGNTLLFAVAAAVIGGTSLFGGRGRARDAVIGGLVIAMIPNGTYLMAMPASSTYVVTMLVLLVAASVDALSRKRAQTS